jgi:arylsulfatase A-like enzyme
LVVAATLLDCSERPRNCRHVIIVTFDTTSRDHLTIYGYERDTTPNLARLAERSVIFDNAVAASTNTAPSHGSILTGLYPQTHGIVRNRYRLADGVTTLAQILGAHGYTTAAFVGGYTLGGAHTGLDRGFGHYDDTMTRVDEREAEATVDTIIEWLEQRPSHGGPLLLLFHMFDPHYPYAPPGRYVQPFLDAGRVPSAGDLHDLYGVGGTPEQVAEYIKFYDAEIRYSDDHMGRLLQGLESHPCWDRTLVVVTADHGETLDERAWVFDHGARLYDEQTLIPMLIRFPGDQWAGRRIDAAVHHVDIAPTILDFLGLAVPPSMQGRSLVPILEGVDDFERHRPQFSLARSEPGRVDELGTALDPEGMISSIRSWPYKLIEYPAESAGPAAEAFAYQLFKLDEDPAERNDLSTERGDVLARLKAELHAFKLETGAAEVGPLPELDAETEERLRSLGYTR